MDSTNTPYDDVFRTLLNDCSYLILPVINEIFGEHYTGNEKIIFSQNEHFLNQQDGNEQERITDSSFRIIGSTEKKYHLECQSSTDSSLLIRFFEYDTQIALDDGEVHGSLLQVSFPHSAVLFLRDTDNTTDTLTIEIATPGGTVRYDIPALKVKKYTVQQIFEKRLLFLIPFHIFAYENHFEEYNNHAEQLNQLKQTYETIKNNLEGLLTQGQIDEYTKCTIIDMSTKVLEHIARKYVTLRKGVKDVMGGKILEYEAKTIRNAGIAEGEARGEARGEEKGIRSLTEVCQELGSPLIDTIEKVAIKFGLDEETSRKKVLMYWKN